GSVVAHQSDRDRRRRSCSESQQRLAGADGEDSAQSPSQEGGDPRGEGWAALSVFSSAEARAVAVRRKRWAAGPLVRRTCCASGGTFQQAAKTDEEGHR